MRPKSTSLGPNNQHFGGECILSSEFSLQALQKGMFLTNWKKAGQRLWLLKHIFIHIVMVINIKTTLDVFREAGLELLSTCHSHLKS